MPRRSVAKRRGGGPVPSMNERRLGQPCLGQLIESNASASLMNAGERCRAKTPQRLARIIRRICHRLRSNPEKSTRIQPSLTGHLTCLGSGMSAPKRFVYVLKNADATPRFYVGLTSDVAGRIADHNAGRCPHTARRRPWRLHVVLAFSDEQRATRFERYLKSGSGRGFAKQHFEE
jgi:putative endonuclease